MKRVRVSSVCSVYALGVVKIENNYLYLYALTVATPLYKEASCLSFITSTFDLQVYISSLLLSPFLWPKIANFLKDVPHNNSRSGDSLSLCSHPILSIRRTLSEGRNATSFHWKLWRSKVNGLIHVILNMSSLISCVNTLVSSGLVRNSMG